MKHYDIFVVQQPTYDNDLQNWLLTILKSNNIVTNSPDFPKEGFMGLDLPAEPAKEIWSEFRKCGAHSMIIPSEYRTSPKVTFETASELAQQYYENELLPKEPQGMSGPTFVKEDVLWYTFRVASKHLAEIGATPASYFINIDKVDGHACKDIKELMQATLDTWFY